MVRNSEGENLSVTLWRMVYQTYSWGKNCLDQIVGEHGLTMEQYLVLMTVKHHDPPVSITTIAQRLQRSTNSVSMIVDRMVKASLLKRVRDRSDRRVVNVSLTSKAENAFKSADIPAWEFMQQSMSPLSYKDKNTFASLFQVVNQKLLEYLNPGADVEGMIKDDVERHDYFMKQWRKQPGIAVRGAKRRGGEKRKTRRKIGRKAV